MLVLRGVLVLAPSTYLIDIFDAFTLCLHGGHKLM